jgi:hypothetical protein
LQPAFGFGLLVGQDHCLAVDVQQLRHLPRARQRRARAQAALADRGHQPLDDLPVRSLRPIELEQWLPFTKLDHMNYPKLEVLLVLDYSNNRTSNCPEVFMQSRHVIELSPSGKTFDASHELLLDAMLASGCRYRSRAAAAAARARSR